MCVINPDGSPLGGHLPEPAPSPALNVLDGALHDFYGNTMSTSNRRYLAGVLVDVLVDAGLLGPETLPGVEPERHEGRELQSRGTNPAPQQGHTPQSRRQESNPRPTD